MGMGWRTNLTTYVTSETPCLEAWRCAEQATCQHPFHVMSFHSISCRSISVQFILFPSFVHSIRSFDSMHLSSFRFFHTLTSFIHAIGFVAMNQSVSQSINKIKPNQSIHQSINQSTQSNPVQATQASQSVNPCIQTSSRQSINPTQPSQIQSFLQRPTHFISCSFNSNLISYLDMSYYGMSFDSFIFYSVALIWLRFNSNSSLSVHSIHCVLCQSFFQL